MNPKTSTLACMLALVVACAAPRGAATTTSSDIEIDTGPCSCRLPQDELTTCCRAGLVLACQCSGSATHSCQLVPTGRSCRSAGSPAGTGPAPVE